MPKYRILLLGGYGQFGARIAAALAGDSDLALLIAGRHAAPARQLCTRLGETARAEISHCVLDLESDAFEQRIAEHAPHLVIHCAGPFQGRDYRVARAALAAGAHYVDLADARDFVSAIGTLDEEARRAGRWAIAGASSVPGLSGAVITALQERFACLRSIQSAISPGNRSERGLATTRAILGYVGRPYLQLHNGRWRNVHGWQSLRRVYTPAIGARWLARCEVPDLSVLPARWPQLATCDFRAGLELRRMHFGLWLASWAVRCGLLRNLPRRASALLALSNRWLGAGSDVGLMQIDMRGRGLDDKPLHLRWRLLAANGDGPQVPATAAVVLARKLARGELPGSGARACLDLFTLDEFLAALDGFAVTTTLETLA
ncbi:MAG: saccharopine dehydrogenase NADP-binding domain-containing protein [Dokdonella sp.]|uniref:saccharopine dehydrogenase family protein n=1 Tax=Dokdonella sp. TaxID=2291710 RepID=UPI0025BDDEF8|nr:saccharopine dehydrogenase NADP-binding domain-containing protein [Dokdonella sp.]MBZ0224247.1 saccharopine dehydrogenase NADP-binding domain-containing protein [Dokdonella sp.]MCC7255493.1 saccharopine dehydrogenase NADP-binding domain-containing protein [Dokdonella sp.]